MPQLLSTTPVGGKDDKKQFTTSLAAAEKKYATETGLEYVNFLPAPVMKMLGLSKAGMCPRT